MKWKFQNLDLPGAVSFQALDAFVKFVKAGTNGMIDIEVFPAGALISQPEVLTAVGKGVIDIAWFSGNIQPGMIPAGPLIQGPMIWQSADDVNVVYFEKGWADLIQEVYLPHNVMVIGQEFEGQIATWGKYPVRTLDDFKGKKIRFFGDYAKMVERLGASTINIPHTESYTALTLGTIDGYGTSVVKFRDMKHYEICKYLLGTPMCSVAPGELIVNLDTWKKLPKDIQTLLLLAGREFGWHTLRLNRLGEYDIFNRATKEWGVTITYLSAEDEKKLRQMAMTLWDETAAKAGPLGQKMIQIVKDHYKSKGLL